MTEQERPAFSKLMILTFNTYQRKVDEEIIDLYFNLLDDYPLAEVTVAVKNHLSDIGKDGSFFPKPADILRQLQGGKGTKALAAWDLALQGVREVGYYGTVTFPDPLILAVIDRMGGWMAFCTMDEDDRPFRQREFIERYSAYLTHPPADIPKSLPGFHEITNRLNGWSHDPRAIEAALPQLVGAPRPKPLPAEEERPALPSGEASKPAYAKAIPGLSTIGKALETRKFLGDAEAVAEKERQKRALRVHELLPTAKGGAE